MAFGAFGVGSTRQDYRGARKAVCRRARARSGDRTGEIGKAPPVGVRVRSDSTAGPDRHGPGPSAPSGGAATSLAADQPGPGRARPSPAETGADAAPIRPRPPSRHGSRRIGSDRRPVERRCARGPRRDRESPDRSRAGLRRATRRVRRAGEAKATAGTPSRSTMRPNGRWGYRKQVRSAGVESPERMHGGSPTHRRRSCPAAGSTRSGRFVDGPSQSPGCAPERIPNRSSRPVAGIRTASTAETTAPTGPTPRDTSNASIAADGPSAMQRTEPSPTLATQPTSPSSNARRTAK